MHRLAELGHDDIREIRKESMRSLIGATKECLDEKWRGRKVWEGVFCEEVVDDFF